MKPVKVVTCDIRLSEWPAMPELRRHHEAPASAPRGTADRAGTAVGLGSSGRAVGRRHRCHRRRSGGRPRAARSHLPDRHRPTRGPPAPASPTSNCSTSGHANLSSRRDYCAPAQPAAKAPRRNCWRAWPRICSTFSPEPTSRTSSGVRTRTARRLYLDASRAKNRHWCGMGTCGNKRESPGLPGPPARRPPGRDASGTNSLRQG